MLWNIFKFLGCQFYICWDHFFKVIIILTRVKIKSIHLLKFIINFTWKTNTSVEAAGTPDDLAVALTQRAQSSSCTIPFYPDLPEVFQACARQNHIWKWEHYSGIQQRARPTVLWASSALPRSAQQPQQLLKLQYPNTFNLFEFPSFSTTLFCKF